MKVQLILVQKGDSRVAMERLCTYYIAWPKELLGHYVIYARLDKRGKGCAISNVEQLQE